MGDLFPAFTGIKKGQGVSLAPTISQATLTSNNQYAKVVICRAGLFCSPALGTPRQSNSEAKSPSAICNDILHSQSHETISHQVAEKGKKLLAKLACECFPGQKDSRFYRPVTHLRLSHFMKRNPGGFHKPMPTEHKQNLTSCKNSQLREKASLEVRERESFIILQVSWMVFLRIKTSSLRELKFLTGLLRAYDIMLKTEQKLQAPMHTCSASRKVM